MHIFCIVVCRLVAASLLLLAGYLVLQIGVQTSFLKEVKFLVAVIEEMGNPFLEQSQDLLRHKGYSRPMDL